MNCANECPDQRKKIASTPTTKNNEIPKKAYEEKEAQKKPIGNKLENWKSRTAELLSKNDDLKKEIIYAIDLSDIKKSKYKEKDQTGNAADAIDDLIKENKNLKFKNERMFAINNKFAEINDELIKINQNLFKEMDITNEKNEMQQQFVNIAAHELRTPTQAIIGYVEMLKAFPDNNDYYYNLILRNAERLNKLVLDILDVSRIENNHLILQKERFDLVDLIDIMVEDANNKIKSENKDRNLVVIYDRDDLKKIEQQEQYQSEKILRINADRSRIGQVLSNLLNNAIRFTKNGTIRVSTTIIKKNTDLNNDFAMDQTGTYGLDENVNDGNHLQNEMDNQINGNNNRKADCDKEIIISVKDEGKGIDLNVLPKLFSKFASEPSSGGTGLGLFISKNIVEAHGGRIWVENTDNNNNNNNSTDSNKAENKKNGVTFSFSLPLCSYQ